MNAQSSFVAPGASAPAPAYSSSAAGETEALVVAPLPEFRRMMIGTGGGHAQYYGGRPRYYGYKNGDDSARFTIYGGGGTMMPLADTSNYLTRNFSIQAGMGPGSRYLKVPVEFDWDQFGFTRSTLENQIAIYDSVFGVGTVNNRLGGNSHIWSFSLQPTFTFYSRGAWGVYLKGGVGFYHKVANFTLPGAASACYYFCDFYQRNHNIDHYTSNAPGYDGGFGVTTRLAPDSRARLYFEARYVVITNQQRYGITNTPASLATVTNSTTDFYPANSNRTTYIPVGVGIRF
jgi:hypothetical protein